MSRGAGGAIAFAYPDSWLTWEHRFLVSLSLPPQTARYWGDRVTAGFGGPLPDNENKCRALAVRKPALGTDAFRCCPNSGATALALCSSSPKTRNPPPTAGPSAMKKTLAILGELSLSPLGLSEDEEFRIAIAGAQEKTALLCKGRKWLVPHGTSAATHILKPPMGRWRRHRPVLERRERVFLHDAPARIAPAAAHTEIDTFADRKALLIERFDRRWTQDKHLLRLPRQDCCRALSIAPSRKHEMEGGPGTPALIDLFHGSDVAARDQCLIMSARIVFWLLTATDGHAKNFSLFLNPGGYAMTPFNDVMSVQPAFDVGQIRKNHMKLAVAVGSSRLYRIDRTTALHFIEVGKACGIGANVTGTIFIELRQLSAPAFDRTRAAMPDGFPNTLAASITNGYKARLRAFETLLIGVGRHRLSRRRPYPFALRV